MIQNSGVDIFSKTGLQALCIDNENVRRRIRQNRSIEITTVPCILTIYSDGGVEKYEGAHSFRWIEEVINRFAPPPPPVQPPRRPIPAPSIPEDYEEPSRDPKQPPEPQPQPEHEQRPRMRPIPNKTDQPGLTSIDDIPTDDEMENTADRYVNKPAPARMIQDAGNYMEDPNLFNGDQTDMRQARKSALRPNVQPTRANDPNDIMSKADAMRKGRVEINQMRPVGDQLQNRP